MRLASFTVDGKPTFGVMVDGGVTCVPSDLSCRTLREWIAKGLPGAGELARAPAQHAIGKVQWLNPIADAAHIVGIGLNTRSHFEETAVLMNRKPGDYPKYPRLFMRSPDSLVACGEPLIVPRLSGMLDYESEIGLVIGKRARYVDASNWRDVVVGITCINDGSVRDFQQHSNQVTAGKNFHASGSCGPAIVTLDEIPDTDALELVLSVNGERRQHLTMHDLIFSFGELVEYVSQPFELQPGDLIATGSSSGVGAILGKYLKLGDEVVISLADASSSRTLLTLVNTVAAE